MFKRLLFLSFFILVIASYYYLPLVNHHVILIIDTVRIDTSVVYLGAALLVSFLLVHWLLTTLKWLRKAPANWQKSRYIKQLEKQQKTRDDALVALIAGQYDKAESQFKQCSYYQNLPADLLLAAKMAIAQNNFTRAEGYLDQENKNSNHLAYLLLKIQLYQQQQEYPLVIATIKQFHRHHSATNHTKTALLQAYEQSEQWEQLATCIQELSLNAQDKVHWQKKLHLRTMSNLLQTSPTQVTEYFQKRSYQEQKDIDLIAYYVAALIVQGHTEEAFSKIPQNEDLRPSALYQLLYACTQYPHTQEKLQAWLGNNNNSTALALQRQLYIAKGEFKNASTIDDDYTIASHHSPLLTTLHQALLEAQLALSNDSA